MAPQDRYTIEPFGGGFEFGARIYGMDLNNFSEEDIKFLRENIQRYLIVIVKGQHKETPYKNWELLTRLDPGYKEYTDEQWSKIYHPEGLGIGARLGLRMIPGAGRLYLMGKGYQGKDHFGLEDVTIEEAFANQYYSKPLPEEDFQSGVTRFQSWHMDGPQYKTVDWADGSGLQKKIRPGLTGFFSTAQLYNMFTEEEKKMADHSWCEQMYYPYEWILACRGNPNGLNVKCEGRERPNEVMEAMPRDPEDQLRLPLVWMNPTTGAKHFQVQPNTVRKLFIRNGPDEKPRIIDNVEEIREFLNKLMLRVLRPENIYVGPDEEGDHTLWFNWGLMHTKIDYPVEYGVRTAHQGWIPAASFPQGPVPIPVNN
ncbi:hypothetical protein PG999_001413 [Apiospora kogelbergensis]|uniref:TauD/TfdA-like domain-containing protein n=1 Tax=Apiospora kogelbergensis TaxID=1337665 RepID=A0AAW0RE82_9PEZI